MQELRVDRDDAPLTLLFEFHDAVNRRKNAVAEQLLAAVPQRVAIDADQLQQSVLERVGGQRELAAERHGRRRLRRPQVHAHGLGEPVRLVGVQAMLAVQRGGEIGRILGADLLGKVLVADAARFACLPDRLKRCHPIHNRPPLLWGDGRVRSPSASAYSVRTLPLSTTAYRACMPATRWKDTWQWRSQVPSLSGTMSAITIPMGATNPTSVRMWLMSTVLPCQCGV